MERAVGGGAGAVLGGGGRERGLRGEKKNDKGVKNGLLKRETDGSKEGERDIRR